MSYMEELGAAAKAAEKNMIKIRQADKNTALKNIAAALTEGTDAILAANAKDLENAEKNGMSEVMQDRLRLTRERIKAMADGVIKVSALKDPVGEVIGGGELENGLSIVKKRVPLGVVGIIYESRPNVTADAAALCLKSSNVCILKGGSDAINSNKAITGIIRNALKKSNVDENAVSLVENTSREVTTEMMRLNKYIDVLIPRGSAGLIKAVVNNATVPVIETGAGNCSVYVDASADIEMAVRITDNAKTQRPSVCNAIENIIVHKDAAEKFFKALSQKWNGKVKIIGDKKTSEYVKVEKIADDNDYATEFLDYVISAKVVDDISGAIDHINKFGTKHSEAIITSSIENARRFQNEIDAAAVYVNASTRFTDGEVFGLGAEIGISTQKLHARGPMGLEAMTAYKYLITGNGQIRT